MEQPPDPGTATLVEAVAAATAAGATALNELGMDASSLIRDLADVVSTPELTTHLDNYVRAVYTLLDQQAGLLSTFNIAFFGRTGAGKSSLLSAFGQLDGSGVSPGSSDFTTDVIPIKWNGCRLVDTPGINGWGRTRKRSELEEAARGAVESADVVLLCFDTQSQQASEFARVARWVQAYGKPTIAVLNVRNRRWRHTAKVTRESERERHSKSVRDHANNIRTELARIGLGDTPVVAINTQRALFARATTPFHGQSVADFESNRAEYGVRYLYESSNFQVLEALLTASISSGGVELRMRSLHEGMRAVRDKLTTAIRSAGVASEAEIATAESRITALLRVLGYPDGDERRDTLLASCNAEFTQLEGIRGTFAEALEGSLSRHVRDIVTTAIGAARQDAHIRAQDTVETISQGTKMTPWRTSRAIFNSSEIEGAEELAWQAYKTFLLRQLDLLPGEHDNIRHSPPRITIALNSGGHQNRVAVAAKAASSAAGVTGSVLGVTPVGWGLMAASMAGGVAGDRLSQRAQRHQADAHAAALQSARELVDRFFDELEAQLQRDIEAHAWRTALPVFAKHTSHALQQRTIGAESVAALNLLEVFTPSHSHAPMATVVLSRAVAAVESGREDHAHANIWLGEDWLAPTTLHSDSDSSFVATPPELQYDPNALAGFLHNAWSSVEDLALQAWLSDVSQLIPEDGDRPSQPSAPRIVVFGDYNAGKSTLIRRLLTEVRDKAPDDIDIRATATTSAISEYQLGRYLLVDTPGLQSGTCTHDDVARRALAGAALVVVVLQVNLLIGDSDLIQSLINGSHTEPSRQDRTLFLINRGDELGVDPATAPADYVNLRQQKVSELIASLSATGVSIERDQVHVLAADPYAVVGDDPEANKDSYAANSAWDGVEPLIHMFTEASDEAVARGVSFARADHLMTELLTYRAQLCLLAEELGTNRLHETNDLNFVTNGLDDLRIILDSIRQALRRTIDKYADQARIRVHRLGDVDDIALRDIVNTWHTAADLGHELQRITKNASEQLALWADEQTSMLGRRATLNTWLAAPQTATGLASHNTSSALDGASGWVGKGTRQAANAAAKLGTHQNTYRFGKAIGVKFKPWGAVKASTKIAKAAPILAAVGAVADGFSMYRDHTKQKSWSQRKTEAINLIDKQTHEIEDRLIAGDEGLIEIIAPLTEALNMLREHIVVTAEATEIRQDLIQSHIDAMTAAIEAAPRARQK
ncbi:50S ribosome-binding GTPase [Gordonia bronchialis]|nr:50S ribosome-binding GTPase [Gordonia bronchialis]